MCVEFCSLASVLHAARCRCHTNFCLASRLLCAWLKARSLLYPLNNSTCDAGISGRLVSVGNHRTHTMDARTASDHAYGSVPSLDNGDGDAPPRRRCVAAVSLGLACISACVPLANKAVLRHGAKKAALTMTACQLFGVALICGLIHAVIACKNGAPLRLSEVRRKARNIGPLGVAFGLKLGATNVGLALVSVEMHVLLAATESIVWTALFARLINGERVRNVTGGLALVGCFAGACLVSTDSYDAGRHVAFYAVALNLVGSGDPGHCGHAAAAVGDARGRETKHILRRVYVCEARFLDGHGRRARLVDRRRRRRAVLRRRLARRRSTIPHDRRSHHNYCSLVGVYSRVHFASRRCWPRLPHRHAIAATSHSQARVRNESSARSRSSPSGSWPLRWTAPVLTRGTS